MTLINVTESSGVVYSLIFINGKCNNPPPYVSELKGLTVGEVIRHLRKTKPNVKLETHLELEEVPA